ncbi:MAG TPA: hypothetical protein GXX36_04935, partial [Clostridiaceae bacterium]|nr:hypothetical protein [Clostridiaceae bacterium]
NDVYLDIDLRYHELPARTTDWSGAQEMWFYADLSEYGTEDVQIRVAFQEQVFNIDGSPLDWHAMGLKNGASYSYHDGTKWETGMASGGCVILPAGFKGWVRIPLDTSTFASYWNGYEKIYLKNINQLNMHIKGNSTTLNKTAYLDSFSIVGDVNGEELPVEIKEPTDPTDPNDPTDPTDPTEPVQTFKEVWGIEGIDTSRLNANLGDYYQMLRSGICTISVAEGKGVNGSNALAWTHTKESQVYLDVDFRYSGLSGSNTDWSGAKEVWFYADLREYGTEDVQIRFAFQEEVFNNNGSSLGLHAMSLKNGATYGYHDGNSWKTGVASSGCVTLPAGFKGWVRIPLDSATFESYWNGFNNIYLKNVNQLNMHIKGNSTTLNKTAYLDSFSIVGDVNGGELPIEESNEGAPVFNEIIVENPNITCYKNSASELIDCGATSPTGDQLFYRVLIQPQNGKAYINRFSGILIYIPNEGFSGSDSFTIEVSDDQFRTAKLDIQVEVSDEENPDQDDRIVPTVPQYPDAADIPIAPELAVPDKGRAVSTLTDLGLEGYVGDRIKGNIENWQLNALEDNPNIIEQIKKAGIATTTTVILDPFGNISSGVYSISVEEEGAYSGKALKWTNLKKSLNPNNVWYNDMDIRFGEDGSSNTDWTGAKEVWFYINNSEMTEGNLYMRFAFEEQNVVNDQGRQSWQLKKGVNIAICPTGGNWSNITVNNNNRFPIPAGFIGWVKIPLDTDHFEIYWEQNPGRNDIMELKHVRQFQMHIYSDDYTVGKSFYLDQFSIVGDVGGSKEAPAPLNEGETYKVFWNLDNIIKDKYTGAIVAWYDEFPGKLLTGMAYSYRLSPDPELYEACEELADAMIDAQHENGYLGIYSGSGMMGGNGANWDVWGHYHSIYGLYHWYLISGREEVLEAAIKAADFIYDYFVGSGRTFDSAGSQTMNLAISHAFAILYQETGDVRYLNAAKMIVVEDWPLSGNWLNDAIAGKDFYQSRLPRWEALHTIMTLGLLYEIEGNPIYYKGLEDIWYSITKTDRHNTGGFTSGEQAVGDPYNTGPIETCCTVAWMALSTEYLQLSLNSYVADELEISFFNGMLSSLLKGDKYVTYNTPMDGSKIASQIDIAFQFNTGSPDFNCCQANAARGLAELSQWGVIFNESDLYLNYYGPSAAHTLTPGGNPIIIRQDTEYPKDGAIKIELDMEKAESFGLNLRIPTWAVKGNSLKVNGKEMKGLVPGEYYRIEREWKDGDVLELNLNMAVHYWVGEKNYSGKTSIYYGPILLALDSKNSMFDFDAIILQTTDLEKMTVEDGSSEGYWLLFNTKTVNNIPVTLVDFTSVGNDSSSRYASWLKVNHNMNYLPFVKGGNPIWNNSPNLPTYKITYESTNLGTIIIEKDTVSFGGSSKFSVVPEEGCKLVDVLVNGKSIGVAEEYTLTNIRQDIEIKAVIQDESQEPTPTPTPTPVPLPTETPTESPTTEAEYEEKSEGDTTIISTEVKAESDSETGAVNVQVDAGIFATLVEKALEAETTGQNAVVEIKVESESGVEAVEIEIPGDAFKELSGTTNTSIKLNTSIGTITLDAKVISKIISASKEDNISISINKVDNDSLPADIQTVVGDRPVYNFTVSVGSIEVSEFDGGFAYVTIPYTPTQGEKEDSIVVYYIDNTGTLKTVRGRYNSETKTVNFKTAHFSMFAVGYNEVNFSDVAPTAWYNKAVSFLAARGIVNGVGGNRFAPQDNVTRADFLIMVMNAFGIEPDAEITNNFDDAGNKYYSRYLGTAKRMGLVLGTGDNKYSPEANISRQDMFVILYRILQKLDEAPAAVGAKNLDSFSDAGDVAAYAKEAMKQFVESGIVSGNGQSLMPKATSTRAEAAQVLYNLLSK